MAITKVVIFILFQRKNNFYEYTFSVCIIKESKIILIMYIS